MITLIINGEVYGPAPRGEADGLIFAGRIVKIGRVERATIEAIGVDVPNKAHGRFLCTARSTMITKSASLFEQLRERLTRIRRSA